MIISKILTIKNISEFIKELTCSLFEYHKTNNNKQENVKTSNKIESKAAELKTKANEFYSQKQYKKAIIFYNEAIGNVFNQKNHLLLFYQLSCQIDQLLL